MADREARRKDLRKKSRESAAAADAELAGALEQLRQANTADLEALKPKVSDPAAFEALVRAVQEATAANETKAQFLDRLKVLGEGVQRVAREALGLLK